MAPNALAQNTASTVSDHLITLLEERGQGDYIGESISQLEHCLQAADLAARLGSSETTVIAALLHDIGQFLPMDEADEVKMSMGQDLSVGRIGHETIGEEYLRGLGFGEDVCRLVGSHVAAKRYLTAIDPSYYEGLSDASKKSLQFQGGPFQGEELQRFKQDPLSEEMIKLRKCDDAAKVVGVEDVTPRTNAYRGMIVRHLEVM
jgi:predicted HD phosphohydrolase